METSRSDVTNEAVSTSNVTPTSVPNYYSLNTPQTQNFFNYAPSSQIPMGNFNFDGVNTRPQNYTYGNTNYLQSLSSGFPALDSSTLSQLSNLAQVSFPPTPQVSITTPTQNMNATAPISNWAVPSTPYHPPTQSMPAPATPEMNAIRAAASSEQRRRNSIPFSFIGGGSIGQSNPLHISSGSATSTAQRQENAYSRARGMSLMSTVSVGVAASCGKRKQMEDEHHIIPFEKPTPSSSKMTVQGNLPESLLTARAKRRPSISAIDMDSLKRPRIEESSSTPANPPATPELVASPAPAASPAPSAPSEKRKPAYAFFAVYDGHGGTACAEYVRMNLHNNIATHPDFGTDVEKAITEGFAKTEKDFAEENGSPNCGTTACVALIYENILYVANVGDSAGLICRKGKAVPLTTPHTLKAPQERERVEKAGGVIFDNRLAHPIWNPELINIGVTRAFGDLYFKDEQFTLGKESGLIATPEISKFPLTNEDKFVILATDGFWDHVTLQETVDYVLKEKVTNAKIICKNLTDLAAKKAGSTLDDNATVLLIKLKGDEDEAPRPPPLFSSTSNLSVPSDNNTESSSKPNLTIAGANSSTSELSSDSSSTNSTSTTTESTSSNSTSNHSEITHSTSNDGKNPISATVSEQSSPSSVYGTIASEPSKQTMADEEFRNRSSEKLSELSHNAIETKVN